MSRHAKNFCIAAVVLLALYTGWRIYVNRRVGTDLVAAGETAGKFMDALRTGSFDDAYAMTSFSFSQRIGRKGLEDLPRKYPALKNVPDQGAVGFETRKAEHYSACHFMFPKVPKPKDVHDYLPVVVKLSVGNDATWKVDDVVFYE